MEDHRDHYRRSRHLLTWPAVTALTVYAVIGFAGPALADGGFGNIDCRQTAAGCDVTAGSGGIRDGGGTASPSGSSGTTTDPCQYVLVDPQLAPPAGATADSGAWYFRTCIDGHVSLQSEAMWLTNVQRADPALLADEAISRLRLPDPEIRASPTLDAPQLVRFPTWMWLDRAFWTPRSATASVPGVSVTATASPYRLQLSVDDGVRVTCTGPGTPWTSAAPVDASSPDCGHTFTSSGRFAVSATVSWNVAWTGGGSSGSAPDLYTTSTRTVVVSEAHALTTRQ